MNWAIIQLFVLIELSFSLAPNELIILILSQPDEYHYQLAEELRADIYNQSNSLAKDNLIQVHLLHETFNHPGYWTFLAIISQLETENILKSTAKWIILCDDHSSIDLKTLLQELDKQDGTQLAYYGYPLHDQEATIIHHFAFFENPQWFSYPLVRSGVVFTVPLIKRLAKRVQEERPTMDFFIDASHELSLFIWQNVRIESNKLTAGDVSSSSSSDSSASFIQNPKGFNNKKDSHLQPSNVRHDNSKTTKVSYSQLGIDHTRESNPDKISPISSNIKDNNSKRDDIDNNNGTSASTDDNSKQLKTTMSQQYKLQMTAVPYLCPFKNEGCAIYPNEDIPECYRVRPETIYFAIKTCRKFHRDRIRIIETTWGQYTVHKRYFSDIADDSIPTISTGVPNTETGHCAKTLSIFKLALEDITEMNRRLKKPIEWIFLSDDDTILSISTLCSVLGCFNSDDDIYLGERYGYRLHSKDGFNYITGGGGIAFSLPTVRKIVTLCTCPTISSPDDMIVGVCLHRLNIKAIHSSRFHQARPLDYSPVLLSLERPISFHKFWQINPIKVYKKWFKKADELIATKSKVNNNCDINSSLSTNIRKNQQNGNENNLDKQHNEL